VIDGEEQMSKSRMLISVLTGVIVALMLAFYLHVQDSAQTGAVAGAGQNHPMMLADGDNGDGGDSQEDDGGQGDQDPGDQIQAPEQQEEQQEDGGNGPGLMF
jgi:hypothetical protein